MSSVYFHRTTEGSASTILRDGFQDSTGAYMLATLVLTGVFVSDEPLDANEGASGEALLGITLPKPLSADYELVEEGKGYREWCAPAAVLNQGAVRLIGPEEEDRYWEARWAADTNGIDTNADTNEPESGRTHAGDS